MSDYCKYNDLDYTPAHGSIDVQGETGEFSVPVSVEVGREMEADGIPVCWPYASIPAWAADSGLAWLFMAAHRIWTLPQRFNLKSK